MSPRHFRARPFAKDFGRREPSQFRMKNQRSAPLEKSSYETLAAFRASLRRFLRFSEEAALEVGLATQKHQALLAVKGFSGREEITIGELAGMLQIRPHSASGLAQRLEADGLLRRKIDKQDHRKVFVRLTPRGTALLEKLSAAHWQELQRIGSELKTILKEVEKPR